MDFDKPKVYGDTSITDGLVLTIETYRNPMTPIAKQSIGPSEMVLDPFIVFN